MNFEQYVPVLITAFLLSGAFLVFSKLFARRITVDGSYRYYRQLFNILFAIVALVTVIAASPIGSDLKGQILSLIGIVISGAIALSSTTLLGNTLAGLMIRMNQNFKSGDFIQVNEYFGKVSARTLLNVEIQTFDRSLTTVPNSYLVANPVKVLPESGVFVNVEVSLGYDVPRVSVEQALTKAAKEIGIDSCYVEVKGLLDHCVLYSLHALVVDMERYFSTKSKLHGAVIDSLHQKNIEIVSPKYINSRSIDRTPVIPKAKHLITEDSGNIDELLFDKANLADKMEVIKEQIQQIKEQLSTPDLTEERKANLESRMQFLLEKLSSIEKESDKL
jgi:small-conductance mechanosensitive channel